MKEKAKETALERAAKVLSERDIRAILAEERAYVAAQRKARLRERKERHQAQLRSRFAEENALNEAKAQQLGLPVLEGTSLQTAWANNLRVVFVETHPECLVAAKAHVSSAWWIRSRSWSRDELVEAVKQPPARM